MRLKAWLALLAVSVSVPALANDDAILKCRAVSDHVERLRCYDGIRVDGAAAPAPVRKDLEQSFGMEALKPAAKLDEIDSSIVGRFDGWRPGQLFRLANGQVWRVVDGSDGLTPEMHNPKVKVVRGALGAMYLEIDGTNRSPKVKRVE